MYVTSRSSGSVTCVTNVVARKLSGRAGDDPQLKAGCSSFDCTDSTTAVAAQTDGFTPRRMLCDHLGRLMCDPVSLTDYQDAPTDQAGGVSQVHAYFEKQVPFGSCAVEAATLEGFPCEALFDGTIKVAADDLDASGGDGTFTLGNGIAPKFKLNFDAPQVINRIRFYRRLVGSDKSGAVKGYSITLLREGDNAGVVRGTFPDTDTRDAMDVPVAAGGPIDGFVFEATAAYDDGGYGRAGFTEVQAFANDNDLSGTWMNVVGGEGNQGRFGTVRDGLLCAGERAPTPAQYDFVHQPSNVNVLTRFRIQFSAAAAKNFAMRFRSSL